MSTETVERGMTVEQFLALPDDGTERQLIRGRLWEQPTTRRNRWHARIEARIAQLLGNWLDDQPEPRGEVFAGEVGTILRRNPDTAVGIDVAYFSAESAARQLNETTLIEGPPVLAVEILSPSDKLEEINEKVDEYLRAGVALIWIIDPHFQTVRVHRPNEAPEMFNVHQRLSGDPHLPGFQIEVSRIFQR
jgi:Uma2 family endonuclease